jgi:uncharacterized tellurite resistance protein B-like protein
MAGRTASAEPRMLRALKDFFDRHIAPAPGRDERHTIELATAALLVETLRIDAEIREPERAAALAAVRGKFGMSDAEADALLDLAEQEVRQATDYFQFTSLINRHFSMDQKIRVIELMWSVAWADDELSPHERHLMRKIVDLLHVPHGDAVAAQARARGSAA